jgi:hypothetical protein
METFVDSKQLLGIFLHKEFMDRMHPTVKIPFNELPVHVQEAWTGAAEELWKLAMHSKEAS